MAQIDPLENNTDQEYIVIAFFVSNISLKIKCKQSTDDSPSR